MLIEGLLAFKGAVDKSVKCFKIGNKGWLSALIKECNNSKLNKIKIDEYKVNKRL